MAHPRYDRLVGLWRLDGDFRDAKWTEFAEKTGSVLTRSYQAVTPAGAEFSIVTDNAVFRYMPVSYTHLDVYKRQPPNEDPFLVQEKGEWRANPCIIRKADGGFLYATTDPVSYTHLSGYGHVCSDERTFHLHSQGATVIKTYLFQ